MYMCVCVCTCVRACVRACVCVCVHEFVCSCVNLDLVFVCMWSVHVCGPVVLVFLDNHCHSKLLRLYLQAPMIFLENCL